ncbi:patatin-like protein [Ornithinimicrobium sp. LYQ103]|uniref:patatin-like protein n=1 Tax=Ornithinimicrobium sp. LYQ103 TaxID=3378796 RepID=UPI003853CAF3
MSAAASRREVRIAPVMTGGTSLAVWMGGATVELYRLVRAPADGDDTYARLLRLTDSTPVIDVITGTSAGGLNGAFLASALAWGVPVEDFEGMRGVWMDSADLDRLLWREADPPSALLDGNSAFVPPIVTKLQEWAASAHERLDAWCSVDLVTTFTAVQPRRRAVVDDFGERLDEEVFAGTIRHRAEHFAAQGETRVDPWMPALLAWGARASASIPGVFEPVFLGAGDHPPETDKPNFRDRILVGGRPLVGDGVWAVDGGLVNNLPLEDALDRIFERRSAGLVRRIALYISPTPTDLQEPPEDRGNRPDVSRSVLTVVSAARAEGVGDSIDVIRDHNRAVARQRAARAVLPLLEAPTLANEGWRSTVADPVLTRFRSLRAEESVARTLRQLDEHIASVPTGVQPPRRSSIQTALLSARLREDLLPTQLPTPENVGTRTWAWGITPIEQAASTVLGIINRTLSLPVRLAQDDTEATTALTQLKLTKLAVHDVLEQVNNWRRMDSQYWNNVLPSLINEGSSGLGDRAYSLYERWPGSDRGVALAALRTLMLEVGSALSEGAPHLTAILDRAGAATGTSKGDDAGSVEDSVKLLAIEAESLHRELRAVAPVGPPDGLWCSVLLLERHVLQTVLFGEVQAREQPVEVMQLSWNSVDLVSGRRPADKLCGTEFARLGAFFMPSWRANDFLWGQLDAAPRLISLLVDPRRLAQLGRTPAVVLDTLGVSVEALDEPTRMSIESELTFLDGSAAVPDELPTLTALLARKRQLEIARHGLPHVLDALEESLRLGASATPETQSFLTAYRAFDRPWTDETVAALLRAFTVGAETMDDQIESKLVTRHLAEGAEVLGRALQPLKETQFARANPWVGALITGVRWLSTPDIFIKRAIRLSRGKKTYQSNA